MKKKQDSLADQAVAAMRDAVRGVVEDHRRRNRPLAIWRDGKVVYRDPHDRNIVREDRGTYGAPVKDDTK
jgi:hypothetical protein